MTILLSYFGKLVDKPLKILCFGICFYIFNIFFGVIELVYIQIHFVLFRGRMRHFFIFKLLLFLKNYILF